MSDPATSIFIGACPGGAHPQALELKRANRHGLIAGAVDIPDKVAAQLNNRVQHKLNAFTPRDQAAVRAAADTFRANPGVDVATVITELKIGEALVSLLQPDGAPSPVERILIKPQQAQLDAATARAQAQAAAAQARLQAQQQRAADRQAARPSLTDKIIVSATRAVTSSMARQLGTQIMRGVLGGLFRGR